MFESVVVQLARAFACTVKTKQSVQFVEHNRSAYSKDEDRPQNRGISYVRFDKFIVRLVATIGFVARLLCWK